MTYQEELRASATIAIWVADLPDEDALITYLAAPFECDFGMILNHEEPPEYACSYPKPAERRRRTSSRPFESLPVSMLLGQMPFEGEWQESAAELARSNGINSTKAVIAFSNLHYRPELVRNPSAPMRFLGNVRWPAGQQIWAKSEAIRLYHPPFPTLVRHSSEGNAEEQFERWEGIIRLSAWDGFARYEDLTTDGWAPNRGRRPGGDLILRVERPSPSALLPSDSQAQALRQLLESPTNLRDVVLKAIYDKYAAWREDYFGTRVSSDGGSTWQTGWELPQQFPPDAMPEIQSPECLRRLIRPVGIYLMSVPRHGTTRLGFSFSCRWDDEHGLGVTVHNGEVVSVGDSTEAFSDFA
jgi:hypothetical protein